MANYRFSDAVPMLVFDIMFNHLLKCFPIPFLLIAFVIGGSPPSIAGSVAADLEKRIRPLLREQDSLLMMDLSANHTLLRIRTDRMRIPASILKLYTALAVLDSLGETYRFQTDFYLSPTHDLKIKGYGDPLLLSEILPEIVQQLHLPKSGIRDIVLDNAFFQPPFQVPGAAEQSIQPYDAPIGALCVNFNTVYFEKGKNGAYRSAEPQTPLLPFVMKRVRRSGLDHGRIVLSAEKDEHLLYAGHLFHYFISRSLPVTGSIRKGRVNKKTDTLCLRFHSPFTLPDVISKMLHFSNNFTANQILITAGAIRMGPPGTLAKGIAVAELYAGEQLPGQVIRLREGSGLSRQDRLTADLMGKVLRKFFPYRKLLRRQGREWYKTGTLTGIQTRAGYIETGGGNTVGYVVLLNSGSGFMTKIMNQIRWFCNTYPK